MTCEGFKALMRWQAEQMRAAIDEAKWYLSEQAGRDVGPHVATTNFHERHLDRCAVDWRKDYCGSVCEHREDCELGTEMIRKDELEQE